MFKFDKTTIIRLPSGRYGYCGKIPASLCDVVPATQEDVMAGRSYRDEVGSLATLRPRSFEHLDDATNECDIAAVNYNVCVSPRDKTE